jgi:hypothetical protein
MICDNGSYLPVYLGNLNHVKKGFEGYRMMIKYTPK